MKKAKDLQQFFQGREFYLGDIFITIKRDAEQVPEEFLKKLDRCKSK